MGFNSDQSTGSDALAVERGGTTGPMFGLERNIHRIFDFVLAAMGVMLFSPILLITSIAIKLESRGPIFVRESEFGYNNRVMKVLKFRLWRDGNSNTPVHLTRVGIVLSQTGIDELPKLFNVLRGEMSILSLLRASLRSGIFRS
ncbi:MAG: sugar transferase [Xanthobacteraceae bacterium]